jgi:arylamine N-acetyltransferase
MTRSGKHSPRPSAKQTPAPGGNAKARSGAGLLDRVLAGWGLPSAAPDLSTLDALHRAYLTRVPFENATKLVKASRTGKPDTAIRGPVEFWEEHLRWGSGGTCFAATSAYQFLLRYLGFASTTIFCHLPAQEPDAHAALLVTVEERPVLVDVGYALPMPVPLPTDGVVRRRTDYYDVEVRPGPQEEYLVFSEDMRGQRFRYRFTLRPAPEGAYAEAWRKTFLPQAPYMRRLALGRFANATRYLYKDPTRIFEITREGERSRLLDGPPVPVLAGVFGLPEPLLEAAIRSLDRRTA